MKLNRQKSLKKDSPKNSQISDNNVISYSKLNANSQVDVSKNLSLNLTNDSKISNLNSSYKMRQNSIAMDKEMLKDNLNFNLNNSSINRNKSPFSVTSRTYNYVEVSNQNGDNLNNNNINNNMNLNNNLNRNVNNNNQNGNTTIDLNLNLSSHLKQNDSIISVKNFL